MMNIELTEQQREAVSSLDGVICLSAGAGCGKTFVLVERYFNIFKKLVEEGKSISEALSAILAVTFTNKAAGEMRERVLLRLEDFEYKGEKLGPVELERVMQDARISTIDSWGVKFLRDHAAFIDLDPEFSIIDPVILRTEFLKLAQAEFDGYDVSGLELDMRPLDLFHEIYRFIGYLKCRLISPNDFLDVTETESKTENPSVYNLAKFIERLYSLYEAWLKDNQKLDFSSVLVLVHNAFLKYPHLLKDYANGLEYILIDEYQDINDAQDEVLRLLSKSSVKDENYFIVGDVGQSIYGFRNANYRNMLEYKTSSDLALDLSVNFRSSNNITQFANRLFAHDSSYFQKLVTGPSAEEGEKVGMLISETREDEAERIAKVVLEYLDKGYMPSDIKILFRNVANTVWEYAHALSNLNIPFFVVGSSEFNKRSEVKDFIAFLKILKDPYDDIALVRCITSDIFGLNNMDLAVIRSKHRGKDKFLEVLQSARDDEDMKAGIRKKLDKVFRYIKEFSVLKSEKNVSDLFRSALRSIDYYKYIRTRKDIDYIRIIDSLEKFKILLQRYEGENIFATLDGFLEYFDEACMQGFSVLTDSDLTDREAVILMSIHQSKGLEFPVTIVAGLKNQSNRQPDFHFDKDKGLIIKDKKKNSAYGVLKQKLDKDHKEEEQRIFYVAVTRAKDKLIISGLRDMRGKIFEFLGDVLDGSGEDNRFMVKPEFSDIAQMIDVDFIKEEIRNKKEENGSPEATPLRMTEGGNGSPETSFLSMTERGLKGEISENFGMDFYVKPEGQIKDKFFYSVTSLATYKKCPYMYYLKHIARVPEPLNKDKSFNHIELGNIVHEFLEAYYSSLEVYTKKSEDELKRMLASALKAKDIEFSRVYIEKFDKLIDYVRKENIPDALEFEKNFILNAGPGFVRGTIDRIDRKANGYVDIIDYKTGEKENINQYSMPMNIYRAAVEKIMGFKVGDMKLVYPLTGKTLTVPRLTNIESDMRLILKNLKEGKEFNKVNNRNCKNCNYKGTICDAKD